MVGERRGLHWARMGGWLGQERKVGLDSHCGSEPSLVCDQTSVSFQFSSHSPLSKFLLPPCCLSPARPANHSGTVCLAQITKHSKGNERSLGHLALPFQAASYLVLASRIQAVGVVWINSPVFCMPLPLSVQVQPCA